MGGSTLKFNFPISEESKHSSLVERNIPLQHNLQSIYRDSDGKSLYDILLDLLDTTNSLQWELINISEDTNLINLTKFQYNPDRDELLVYLNGLNVLCGTDKDYIKSSPTQITFNYNLKSTYEVVIILAGTISSKSFGDDLFTSLNKFIQLTDTPKTYQNMSGKYLRVNESQTGLIFDNAISLTNLICKEYDINVNSNTKEGLYIPFMDKGLIKGIKVTGNSETQDFNLSMWTVQNGYWIYYSGDVTNILWDIMDIPFISESNDNTIYIELQNKGVSSNFHLQIYIMI